MDPQNQIDPTLPRVTFADWSGGPSRARLQTLLQQADPSETNVRTQVWLELGQNAERERDFPAALLARQYAARAAYHADASMMARELATYALSLARELADAQAEPAIFSLLAVLALDDGRSKDAHDHLQEAIAGYDALEQKGPCAVLLRWYGEHLQLLGAEPEAKAALSDAARLFRELGDEQAAKACVQGGAALERPAAV